MMLFDVDKSEARTAAVDVLFDQLISFQLEGSRRRRSRSTRRAASRRRTTRKASALVAEAREPHRRHAGHRGAGASQEIRGAFTGGKEKGARQAELEQQWASFARERYAQAKAKADEAAEARAVSAHSSPDPAKRGPPLFGEQPGEDGLDDVRPFNVSTLSLPPVSARHAAPRRPARWRWPLRSRLSCALFNSIYVSAMSVVWASAIALPLAYHHARFEFRGALLIQTLGVLPLVMPPFVGAVAMQLIFGRNGTSTCC
jgi:ABC-type sugar transport system permease subunit